MDKQEALALIKTARNRALEEQSRWRNRIDSLKGTPKEALRRIRAIGAESFMKRLGEIDYPVSWQDRRKLSSHGHDWDDMPLEKLHPKVSSLDLEVQLELMDCHRVVEHRDRLKALAKYYELLGTSLISDCFPETNASRWLTWMWSLFVGWRTTEDMRARARALIDDNAEARYASLATLSHAMLASSCMSVERQIAAADEPAEPEPPEFGKEATELLARLAELRGRFSHRR